MDPQNNPESQLSAFKAILAWKAEEQQFASTLAKIDKAGVEHAFGAGAFEDLAKPGVEALNRRVGECVKAKAHLAMEDRAQEKLLAKMQQVMDAIQAQQARVKEHQSKIKTALTGVDNYRTSLLVQRDNLVEETNKRKTAEVAQANEPKRLKLEDQGEQHRADAAHGGVPSQPKPTNSHQDLYPDTVRYRGSSWPPVDSCKPAPAELNYDD